MRVLDACATLSVTARNTQPSLHSPVTVSPGAHVHGRGAHAGMTAHAAPFEGGLVQRRDAHASIPAREAHVQRGMAHAGMSQHGTHFIEAHVQDTKAHAGMPADDTMTFSRANHVIAQTLTWLGNSLLQGAHLFPSGESAEARHQSNASNASEDQDNGPGSDCQRDGLGHGRLRVMRSNVVEMIMCLVHTLPQGLQPRVLPACSAMVLHVLQPYILGATGVGSDSSSSDPCGPRGTHNQEVASLQPSPTAHDVAAARSTEGFLLSNTLLRLLETIPVRSESPSGSGFGSGSGVDRQVDLGTVPATSGRNSLLLHNSHKTSESSDAYGLGAGFDGQEDLGPRARGVSLLWTLVGEIALSALVSRPGYGLTLAELKDMARGAGGEDMNLFAQIEVRHAALLGQAIFDSIRA
jgi:hypothetical protein